MKAGIITHYDVHNHGAHLQMYALIQTLKSFGYEAKALQYRKNYDFMGGEKAAVKYSISIKSLPHYAGYLLKNGVARTLYNYNKRKILSKFRTENELVGEFYAEAKNLDVVIIGSDEIFSVEAGPNPWYYGIGVPCDKFVSYAASFGPTNLSLINEHHIGALVEAGIKNLDYISVRDKNSFDIVEHYTNKKVSIVCDPVLLYDFEMQNNLADQVAVDTRSTGKYCIVYSYDYNMNEIDTIASIRNYAEKRNLKVYSVAYFHKWCDRNLQVKPLDIFKWFSNAEMVFTDTFHGSVISLVTGTQFVAQIRNNENKLAYLLEQFGVSERKVNSFTELDDVVVKPIDYENVKKNIMQIRHQSKLFLKNALEENNV